MDKVSYALGLNIGKQLAQMGAEGLNIDDFAQAIKDVLAGNEQMTVAESQKVVNQFFQEAEAKQRAKAAEMGKAAKAEGEKYLADNAKKDGVITTKSGLQYMVLQEGTGKSPKATDSVKCHYEGFLIDGTVFDSSIQRGEPATFPLGGVIAGWTEGLQLMKEGGKTRFFIPYNLAYGESGAAGSIPPYAALIFDVELIEVK
jgi:FKBP-type peptidyl-prolyl cis-trans isomerase FklB